MVLIRDHMKHDQVLEPIISDLKKIFTIPMSRIIIYNMKLETYLKYTGAMLCDNAKLIDWDEIIIRYPMAWYEVLHDHISKVILCLAYHICSQIKPIHVCY